jgi:DNA polymerase-3 subunit epsilon
MENGPVTGAIFVTPQPCLPCPHRANRWSPGEDGRPKAWYVDVDEAKRDDEIEYLRKSIYLRDVDPFTQAMTATDRFSIGT